MILKPRDIEIFNSRYKVVGDCWIWTGSIRNDGYGRYPVNRQWKGAHRVAYELYKGPIPEGLLVRHKCDNPLCINPEHLELGTNKDNVWDMYLRGRGPDKSGENNPNYKHGNRVGEFQNRVFK